MLARLNLRFTRFEGRPGKTFWFFWAFALGVHLGAHWSAHFSTALCFALCVAVVLQPDFGILRIALAAAQLWALFDELPNSDNHFLLAGFVNAAFLLAEAARRPVDWRPAGRAFLLVLYFFAVFHKLNRDFLDPALSCVGTLHEKIDLLVPGLLPSAGTATIRTLAWLTLAAETAIPLLLLLPRARKFGVGLGLIFHLLLALAGVSHFSSLVFALYLLFIPDSVLHFLESRSRPWIRSAYAVYLVLLAGLYAGSGLHEWSTTVPGLEQVSLALWSALIVLFFAPFLARTRIWPGEAASLRLSAAQGFLLGLLLLNGFSPYLGLKTRATFSMYSNLRTEGGVSNHLLVPADASRWGGMQEPLVEILEGSSPLFSSWYHSGLRLTPFEFRSLVSSWVARGHGSAWIRYRIGGQERFLPRLDQDLELSRPWPLLARKVLAFRPVPAETAGAICSW